jgi:serine/threonine protein kinase
MNNSESQFPHSQKFFESIFLNRQPLEKIFRMPKYGEMINSSRGYYQLGKILGNGNFGTAFECLDEWGNHLVAKVLHPLNRKYEEVKNEWFKELDKLVQLRHPHITFIHDAFEYNDTFYLITERCIDTLETLIKNQGDSGELLLPYVARDILQAVEFIHLNNYVHKDIHPGNVFISEVQRPRIYNELPLSFIVGDVGISNLEKDINVFNTVLADWMLPPEFLDPGCGTLGKSIDIYHTGLLLLSVLCGEIPNFTKQEILDAKPRKIAESLLSPYGSVIAKMLRRRVCYRANNIREIWNEIYNIGR